ncbi:ATP-grasp domain-containing protein [Enterococcus caccae]|uniref:ATP-grasp domain-containing protein n=1 Tax=Enterococcus caccae ATCC BAA-1240 TaxID=1158612 RepID=R3W825_9ENTE|nr:ATP-grasp domain-containing protein [Enterococcus caccae]EOL43657.1 hypothetical protein UC7_02987 [Enterococcus caccae ATCC BAA-1240]EOT67943.1 hypothetical protein I580_00325 [Enterococcus caccae ATCC BAA-1240]OJG28569.1 hypothetical protein RU98_GL000162 [Enterococcus caccae]
MAILCIKCSEKQIQIIRELEHEVVYICDEWDRKNLAFLSNLELFKKKISVNNLDSIEELSSAFVDILEDNISINSIISGAEYGIFAYGILKTLFENTNSGVRLAIDSRDKRAMKEIFKKAGVKHANYYPQYSSEDFNTGVNHGLNYPLVVKPVTGTGTFNTEIVKTAVELATYFEQLQFHPALVNKKVTLEEYIVGEEYHVDILWREGTPLFTSIGKYYIPRILIANDKKKNGSYTILYEKHKELYDQVIKIHEKINNLIQFPTGVTHSEFFIKDGEIYFSEIAIRYGGARIPEMIQNTYGIDLVEEWLKQESGEYEEIQPKQSNLKYTSWLNLVPEEAGIIEKIPTKEEFFQFPWIKDVYYHMREGDEITFTNPSEWLCCIIFEADSEEMLMNRVDEIYQHFRIVTK